MMLKKPKDTYEAYADIYDAFKGDRSETIHLLEALIKKHRPTAKHILDLACGTGTITKSLAESYEVVGLDNAPKMLSIASKKLPSTQFILADMADFSIAQKFDVIYCLHNSVNHLLSFREWQALFKNVATHLNEGGIFIFDINPIEKMDKHVQFGINTTVVGEDYVMTQITKDTSAPERYNWDMKIFSKQTDNNFMLHHEAVTVSTYPLDQVTYELSKNFKIVDFFIVKHTDKSEDIGRAYYVASVRKPGNG